MGDPYAAIALVWFEGRLLILKRADSVPVSPGRWCLPGGHKNPNESLSRTVEREIEEETGLRLKAKKLRGVLSAALTYIRNVGVFAIEVESTPELRLSEEHTEAKWVTVQEALSHDLMPIGREALGIWMRRKISGRCAQMIRDRRALVSVRQHVAGQGLELADMAGRVENTVGWGVNKALYLVEGGIKRKCGTR